MRLIDADAFIEENKDIIDCEIDHPKYQDTLRELIDQAPTVKTFTLADIEEQYRKGMEKGLEEAERPHGEWKEFTVSTYRGTDEFGEPKWGKGKKFICERCLRRTVIRENFCPHCGADMRKEGEAE